MANVWYVGVGTRTISRAEWKSAGIADADPNTWSADNAWSIAESEFTEDQLLMLESDNQFLLGQTGGRTYPDPSTAGEVARSAYAYYVRIMEVYNGIISTVIELGGVPGLTGPQGPQGPQGPAGATGSAGAAGTNGLRGGRWYVGTGAPGSIPEALAGDKYLNTANGDVYTLS